MPQKFRRDVSGNTAKSLEQQSLLESSEEEDFFLQGPVIPNVVKGSTYQDPQINKVQSQVKEVVNTMQSNISRIFERGDKLDDLQDKSDNLNDGAFAFRNRAQSLRKNLWWKECRMRILLAVVIIGILVIIIVAIIVQQNKKQNT